MKKFGHVWETGTQDFTSIYFSIQQSITTYRVNRHPELHSGPDSYSFSSHLLEDSTQVFRPEGKTGNISGACLFQLKVSKNNTTHEMFHIVHVICLNK